MFMINKFSKWFLGDTTKETIIEISEGQVYLVRPLSVKGYSELIFKDARAEIRRTGTQYNYQLVLTRAYEEGEEELLSGEEGEDGGLAGLDKDEQTFLLDQTLQFRVDIRDTGEKVFAWKDLSGSEGDLWEFVCDRNTKPETVAAFEEIALSCQFERKYKRSAESATAAELEEFSFQDEPIASASPALTPVQSSVSITSRSAPSAQLQTEAAAADRSAMPPPPTPAKALAVKAKPHVSEVKHPQEEDVLCKERAELHLFDLDSGSFHRQEEVVEAVVLDLGSYKYWLKITGKESNVGRSVEDDLSPVFNFEYLSAIFNIPDKNGDIHSWLLRFKDQDILGRFQHAVAQAQWEHNNHMKWQKLKDTERDYIAEAFEDLTMDDREAEAQAEDEEEEEDDDDDRVRGVHAAEYDSDESEDDTPKQDEDGNVNSQLAVGYKHDRSFVVRGSKIGVFKHTPENNLEFATNISKVQTPKGKLFSPTKVMLHASDRNLILRDEENPNSVYRMDLEVGKVVDEWKIHDDIGLNTFLPEDKFAQMTDQQTFLGLNKNTMFRVDPRLAGNKLVEADMKQYANTSRTAFTTASTTEKGYIAVGSANGDVRLFDRLGIRAKTALPALGDPIIGLDVSADGRWILATTKTYLLLVDAMQHEGKDEGKLGFEKAFAKDSKPKPRRLALTPAHVAQFQHETKTPLSFTSAKFNTGPDAEETTVVTSTGPFIVTWSLKKILSNRKDPYSIKRYAEEVKADNFRFGSDKNIVVALPNEVDMVMKKALKRPTRESIAPPRMSGGFQTPRRKGYLGRNDIVNSPY